MSKTKFIPEDLYYDILKNMPIICVDGIILKNDEVLLLLRDKEPEKNRWWFPGGRVLKNESLEQAILRKVKEETNLECSISEMFDVTQTYFNSGPNNIPVHTINICFTLTIKSGNVLVDNDHKGYGWFGSPPNDSSSTIKYIFKKLK